MRPFIYSCSLLGGAVTNLLVDTGFDIDGALESGFYRREIVEQHSRAEGEMVRCPESGRMWFEKCVWNGATYTNLLIANGGTDFSTGNGQNLIGLRFLARHVVTFDFATRTLYLKPTHVGPLADVNREAATQFLTNLKAENKLPGWSDKEDGTMYCDAHADFAVFDGRKTADASTYHYIVRRAFKDRPWKLATAWRMDQNDRTIQKYHVP